jgi:hypothetical protein
MKTFAALVLIAMICVSATHAVVMPRHKAPNFEKLNAVVNNQFSKLSLSDFQGKYLVMLFYPFGMPKKIRLNWDDKFAA